MNGDLQSLAQSGRLPEMAAGVVQSIYDLPPLETGGSRSRHGLAFQDHVTAGFCLDLLQDEALIEVWCESQDDVTLIWKSGETLTAEFVQAKSDELNQLWSISRICQREDGKIGTSILERSLAYDRCVEATLFRLVTLRPFKSELEILTWERRSAARDAAAEALAKIQDDVAGRVGEFSSANKADCREWVKRAFLEARHSEDAVVGSNLRKTRRVLEQRNFQALEQQAEEIYSQLVAKIATASCLDARLQPVEKRFTKARISQLLEYIASAYLRAPMPGGGKTLHEKMEKAGLPPDTIEQAQELRRAYRIRSLSPKYQQPEDRPLLDAEVAAILHALKAKLDSGALPDNGRQFLALCLDKLEQLQGTFPPAQRPSLSDLHGSMYSIADRCMHRFRRAES